MSAQSLKAKAMSAGELLAGGSSSRQKDDSEDELYADVEPKWEWLYEESESNSTSHVSHDNVISDEADTGEGPTSPTIAADRPRRPRTNTRKRSHPIFGAQLGKFIIRIGSTVTLRAGRNDIWVAIITKFLDPASDLASDEDEQASEDEDALEEKRALFTWLSSPREIRNPRHRRADCLPNELYATVSSDVNPLEAILGRANVVSPREFQELYPGGKIPKSSADNGKLFVCRRGANLRTATYTDEFKWGVDYMQGLDGAKEVEELRAKVDEETQATRKRKPGADDREGLKDFVVPDGEVDTNTPNTPHKRRKIDLDDEHTPISRPPKTTTPKRTPASKFTTPTHRRIIEKTAYR